MELLILGLDGVAPKYLERARQERDLPNFDQLFKESFYSEIESTMPAITIPAWPTMFSGYDPGKFGAYHLGMSNFEEWILDVPKSERFRGKFFWDNISQEVGIHYVPGTTPPYQINGLMRGGFPSPKDFSFYPEELSLEMDFDLSKENCGDYISSKEKIAAEIRNYCTERKVAGFMLDKEPDVFVSVVRATDKASHYADSQEQILDVYEKVDEEVGRYIDIAEKENATLIVVSDHGFSHFNKKFNISKFLEKQGYTQFEANKTETRLYKVAQLFLDTPLEKYVKYAHKLIKSKTGRDLTGKEGNVLEAYSKESKVLPVHYGSGKDCILKVHTEDMKYGGVSDREKNKIVEKISQELLEVEKDGRNVIEKVYKGEEIYSGIGVPEIAVRATDDFVIEVSPSEELFSKTSTYTHHESGIFFAKGKDIDQNAELESKLTLYNVAPLIYSLLDERMPEELEKNVPRELIPSIDPKTETTEISDISI